MPTAADALLGAGHILAEQFSEQAELRQRLREILQRTGMLVSTRIGGDAKARRCQGERDGDRETTAASRRTDQGRGLAANRPIRRQPTPRTIGRHA